MYYVYVLCSYPDLELTTCAGRDWRGGVWPLSSGIQMHAFILIIEAIKNRGCTSLTAKKNMSVPHLEEFCQSSLDM